MDFFSLTKPVCCTHLDKQLLHKTGIMQYKLICKKDDCTLYYVAAEEDGSILNATLKYFLNCIFFSRVLH